MKVYTIFELIKWFPSTIPALAIFLRISFRKPKLERAKIRVRQEECLSVSYFQLPKSPQLHLGLSNPGTTAIPFPFRSVLEWSSKQQTVLKRAIHPYRTALGNERGYLCIPRK